MILVYNKHDYLPDRFYPFHSWMIPVICDYDYGIWAYDIDIYKDNAEAHSITELCFRFDFEFDVVTREEFLDDWPHFEGFLQEPTDAIADLEFLDEMLSRH